jgi:hypothetical protein
LFTRRAFRSELLWPANSRGHRCINLIRKRQQPFGVFQHASPIVGQSYSLKGALSFKKRNAEFALESLDMYRDSRLTATQLGRSAGEVSRHGHHAKGMQLTQGAANGIPLKTASLPATAPRI